MTPRACVASVALVAASLLSFEGRARAGEGDYPVAYVERPLTLPRLTLAPEVGVAVTHIGSGFSDVWALSAGAAFGITNDLEVHAIVVPLALSPSVQYGSPLVGATFRFLDGPIEAGGELEVEIPTQGPSGVSVIPGVPVAIHLGKLARIDTGVFVPIDQRSGSPTIVGLTVPAAIAVQVADVFYVGAQTGVSMELNPPSTVSVGQTTVIPLGLFAGYTVASGSRPIVDIGPSFEWFDFLTPGVSAPASTVNGGIFTAGIAARGYIYF